MISDKIKTLHELKEKKNNIEDEICQELKKTFPIDSVVGFLKSGHRQIGNVKDHHTFLPRLRVHNIRTGKEYWVELYDIMDAYID